MEELRLYIFKKYGLKLSQKEANEFLDWFSENKDHFNDEDQLDREARKYLYNRYKGRPIQLHEEDLSNMNYLLALLKKETEDNK